MVNKIDKRAMISFILAVVILATTAFAARDADETFVLCKFNKTCEVP